MALNDLDHECGHRKLGVILRSVPHTIHAVELTHFCLIRRCSSRQNQVRQIVKHFDFDLTCVAIGELEVSNARSPSIGFPALSNAV